LTVDQRSQAVTSWLGRGAKPEDVATKVHNLPWPFFLLEERPLRGATGSGKQVHGNGGPANLSIQDYASLLVNPKVLLHQLAILPREETIREANEAVGRRHSCAKKAVEHFGFLLSI